MTARGSVSLPVPDYVGAYTETVGTGSVQLGSVVQGLRLPPSLYSGATMPYVISDQGSREAGECVLTLASGVWTATRVVSSATNSDGSDRAGSPLNLSGSAQWFLDVRGQDIAYANDLAQLQSEVTTLELQTAYAAFVATYTTATSDLAGVRDDYADSSGIDTANSSGLTILSGDINNIKTTITAIPNNKTADSDTPTGSGVTSASVVGGSGLEAYRAADNSASSYWGTFGSSNAVPSAGFAISWSRTFSSPVQLQAYSILGRQDSTYYTEGPTEWKLYGSNDGGNTLTLIDSRTGQTSTSSTYTTAKSFNLTLTAPYKTYIFYFTANNGSTQALSVADISLTQGTSGAPQAAVLRRQPITYSSVRKRAYVFQLADVASGVVLNTDLIGAVGDGTTFINGNYKNVGTIGAHSVIALYGADGNLGVDYSSLNTTKLVTRDTMTATGRIDVRETVAKAA